jgi:hypothetical protein
MHNIYKYAALALTIWLCISIIYIGKKTMLLFREKNVEHSKFSFRQSTIHELIQNFLPTNGDFIRSLIAQKGGTHPSQQSRQRYSQDKIKVIIVGDNAYWVQDNIFYQTVVSEDGDIQQDLAIPVDTTNMEIEDIDRLMLILDDLRSAEKNDGSGSSDE